MTATLRKQETAVWIPAVIAILVMCGALLDRDSLGRTLFGGSWTHNWPYGYYIFLRWIVCLSSIIIAVNGTTWEHSWAGWLFGLQALLYNPIVRVHLNVEAWTVINLVSIAAFCVGIFTVKPRIVHAGGT
ncbi:MAG TPA: DUF6804 family protein [Nitrospiraceae bacterium]|nr:DUF6804 family protein [Nitrospiraceae bacterium]